MYALQWLVDVFLQYLDEWGKEAADHEELPKKEQRRMRLSRETLLGLLSAVKAGSVFLGRICTSGAHLYERLCIYLII